MASVLLSDVYLSYPINTGARSLRQAAVDSVIGGLVRRSSERSNLIYVEALKQINLTANDGDRIGLIGHNGAGKTTLLKVLAGIYGVSHGYVGIKGRVENLISTGFGIDPEETGRENIEFVLKMAIRDRKEREQKLNEIITFTELEDFVDLPVRTYSAGMQTRLSFSIATAIQPDILLMDEVIGGGDAGFFAKAERRLEELASITKIIFLASHSDALIRQWCNRVIWLDKGKICFDGAVDEGLNAYASLQTADQITSSNASAS